MKHFLRKSVAPAILAILGGCVAGSFAAMMDPTKYDITHDLGSGKLWKFFFMGGALTLAGMVLHSPFGQRFTSSIKQSQEQIEQTKRELAQAKEDLKERKE